VGTDALARNIDAHLGHEPEPEECRRSFYVLANVLSQTTGDEPMPPESDFWDPSMPLLFGLRNVATLYKQEIMKRMRRVQPRARDSLGPRTTPPCWCTTSLRGSRATQAPSPRPARIVTPRGSATWCTLWGWTRREGKATSPITCRCCARRRSRSLTSRKGPRVRKPVQRTRSASAMHARDQCTPDGHAPHVGGAHGRARAVNSRILRDKHDTPYFPQASQNVATTAAVMRAVPPQASPEGERVMDELRVLLEVAACHHANSSEDRRRPAASSYWSPNERAASSAPRGDLPQGAGPTVGATVLAACRDSH
jgi:hypothetical protein